MANKSINNLIGTFATTNIGSNIDIPNNLVCIDTSNHRIGINTIDPSYSIHIEGSANCIKTPNLIVDNNLTSNGNLILNNASISIEDISVSNYAFIQDLSVSNYAFIQDLSVSNHAFIPDLSVSNHAFIQDLSVSNHAFIPDLSVSNHAFIQDLSVSNLTIQNRNLNNVIIELSNDIIELSNEIVVINGTLNSFFGGDATEFSSNITDLFSEVEVLTTSIIANTSDDNLMIIKNTDISGDLSVNYNLYVQGDISANYDYGGTSYFGKAAIGYMNSLGEAGAGTTNSYAGFSHLRHADYVNFAIAQDWKGTTHINGRNKATDSSGNGIEFKIDGHEKARLNNNGFGIGTISPNYTLDVSGDAQFTGDLSVNGNIIGIPDVDYSSNGLMTISDKSKLDGIESSANNYSLPPATALVLGGISVGTDLSINSSGELSVDTNDFAMLNSYNSFSDGAEFLGDLSVNSLIIGNVNGVTNSVGIKYNGLDNNSYALIQDNSGSTFINAASSKKINFQIDNNTKMQLASDYLYIDGSLSIADNVSESAGGPAEKLYVDGTARIKFLSIHENGITAMTNTGRATGLYVNGDSSFNGNVTISGDTEIEGTLTMNNAFIPDLSVSNLTITNDVSHSYIVIKTADKVDEETDDPIKYDASIFLCGQSSTNRIFGFMLQNNNGYFRISGINQQGLSAEDFDTLISDGIDNSSFTSPRALSIKRDNGSVGIKKDPGTNYSLDVSGDVFIAGDLSINGNLTVSGDLTINGKLILPTLTQLDTTGSTTQISNAIYYYEDTDTLGSGVGGGKIKLLAIYA